MDDLTPADHELPRRHRKRRTGIAQITAGQDAVVKDGAADNRIVGRGHLLIGECHTGKIRTHLITPLNFSVAVVASSPDL